MILFSILKNYYRFEVQEAPGSTSFFTEIIASISDVKFARDGRYMRSRDYMTLKVSTSVHLCVPICLDPQT